MHIRELLADLTEGRLSCADGRAALVKLATRLIVEEALEAESRDVLGREHDERGASPGQGRRSGVRMGCLKTAQGPEHDPPRGRRGFAVLLTGLSGAGKSTLARALAAVLRENAERRVTLLDGDVVRKLLSSDLGYSRRDREVNLRRIGFVAAEVVRQGGERTHAV